MSRALDPEFTDLQLRQLADAAHVSLGPILSITEVADGRPAPQTVPGQETPDPRIAAGPRPRSDGGPLAGLRARMGAPAHEDPAPIVEAPARPSRPEPPAAPPAPAAGPEAEQPAPRSAPRRPAARTRPAPPPEEDDDERESAIDRLFAPLAESDHTEPIPAVRPRTPRTPRQPRS